MTAPATAFLRDLRRDFVKIAGCLLTDSTSWFLTKGCLVGALLRKGQLRWDGDVDVCIVVPDKTYFWKDRFQYWQKAFRERGWELTKRTSFLAAAVPQKRPGPGWRTAVGPWKEAVAQARVLGARQRNLASQEASKLRNDSTSLIRCRGPLRLDLHVAEINQKDQLMVGHRPCGKPIMLRKQDVLPTAVRFFDGDEVRVPRHCWKVAREMYGHDIKPAYKL